jgi:hypothetical protein
MDLAAFVEEKSMRQVRGVQIINRNQSPMGPDKPVPVGKIRRRLPKSRSSTIVAMGYARGGSRYGCESGDTVITDTHTPSSVVIQFTNGVTMFLCENAFVVFD